MTKIAQDSNRWVKAIARSLRRRARSERPDQTSIRPWPHSLPAHQKIQSNFIAISAPSSVTKGHHGSPSEPSAPVITSPVR